MSLAHQKLAVAIGAAKEQARVIVFEFRRRRAVPTGQANAVYLALIVLYRQLLDPYAPTVAHFIPDLEHIVRECDSALAPVKPLVEAALRFARDGEDAP